jgi:hypothetical protein
MRKFTQSRAAIWVLDDLYDAMTTEAISLQKGLNLIEDLRLLYPILWKWFKLLMV